MVKTKIYEWGTITLNTFRGNSRFLISDYIDSNCSCPFRGGEIPDYSSLFETIMRYFKFN